MKKLLSLILLLPFYTNANMLLLPSYEGDKELKIYIDETHSNKQHLLITEELYGNRITYPSSLDCDNKKFKLPSISYLNSRNIDQEKSYKAHIINHACKWVATDKVCGNYLQIEAAYSMLIKSCYNDLGIQTFKPNLIKQDFIYLNKHNNCKINHNISQNKMKLLSHRLKEKYPDMHNYCLQNQDIFNQIEAEIKKEMEQPKNKK